ncbi:tetratricopeptide repeat protein [uncultured Marinobacter sp.]|uniref:tetratricopeptide repeat protein n=1 Tax=uncultured Marinobacter sp. TaxID=187379 RepID=UPI0030D9F8A0
MRWTARGGAFINETPKENLDRMTEFMNRAQSDLTRTLDLEGSALWAYCLRIRIAKAGGNYPEALRALEQATARYPLTYLGRKYYLESLDPKWGGTLLSMTSFANSAQQHVGSNPRLQQLVSYAHYEAGRMAYIRKEYSQALEYLSIAIDKGTQPRAYFVRGQTHARLGDHEKALTDFNAVINRGSEDGDYYYWRARSFAGLKRFNEALMDIQRAHALKPDDECINNLRVRLMGYVRTPDIASADEGSSGSEDAESLFRQARKLIEDNQPEQAKAILDRAIDLKPDEFRYYQLIDHALFKQGKLMDILGYWERYLSIKPNDHRAYLERAGTYYHLQDFDAAKLDAAKAVDLGSEKAKALYDRLQQVPRG